MSKHNTEFNLSINDIDVIETALRKAQTVKSSVMPNPHEINNLLGKIHDQKAFYRPTDGTYISG